MTTTTTLTKTKVMTCKNPDCKKEMVVPKQSHFRYCSPTCRPCSHNPPVNRRKVTKVSKVVTCKNPLCQQEFTVVARGDNHRKYCSTLCHPSIRKRRQKDYVPDIVEEKSPLVVTIADVTHPGWLALVETLLDDLLEEQTREVNRLIAEAPKTWQCECGRRSLEGWMCRCGRNEATE